MLCEKQWKRTERTHATYEPNRKHEFYVTSELLLLLCLISAVWSLDIESPNEVAINMDENHLSHH